MVVDLKVPVRSLSCDNRACYVWKPSRKFFSEFAKENVLFAKVPRKLDITNHSHCIHYSLFRATTSCHPGARGPAGEWYRTFTFPFTASSQASEGMGSPQPKYHGLEAHPRTLCWYCLAFSEVSRSKLQIPAAKLPKVRLCESQTPRPPGVCGSSDAPPADGSWGLRIRVYFRESSSKDWAKVKEHFEGSGPVSLAKKIRPNQEQPVLRRGFRDASRTFTRLWRSYPW